MTTPHCANCDRVFKITEADLGFYAKVEVPPPTRCPRCRMKRRMSFWNQRKLFRKKDEHSGKEIFSAYTPASPVNIYERKFWLSDAWDRRKFERDYDPSKNFFLQFKELYQSMPLPALAVADMVNSDFCNNANHLKDCYLCFDGNMLENCSYAVGLSDTKDSLDVFTSESLELCYEVSYSSGSYECFFSDNLKQCGNVWFSRDCEGCTDCIGCVNLRNKKYHIFNKEYTKEAYEEYLAQFDFGSYKQLTRMGAEAREFTRGAVWRFMHGAQNSNVVGEYLYNSSNAEFCYMGAGLENVKHCQFAYKNVKDTYDFTNWGVDVELTYDTINSGVGLNNVKFCSDVGAGSRDMEYCITMANSSNMFGCVGMRDKKFHILNKEYSEGEFNKLRKAIIADMDENPYTDSRGKEYKYGEFFPPDISPYNYTDTAAQDYYPLSDGEVSAEGYRSDLADTERSHKVTLPAGGIPDCINDVSDSILKEAIGCGECGKAFRLIEKELRFYKKYKVPIPRKCPDCRYLDRANDRNPLTWWERKCMCAGKTSDGGVYSNNGQHLDHTETEYCPNTFKTNFPADSDKVVYCESCYQREIK